MRRSKVGELAEGIEGLGLKGFLLVALALAGACGAEHDEVGADTVETVPSPLTAESDELVPFNGEYGKVLTYAPRESWACFLTMVGGQLRTMNQSIWVHNQSSTYWVAGTTNETNQKWIGWHCVRVTQSSQYSTHYWSASLPNPAPVDMGPSNDRVCFLNNVNGWYNGNGEQLRIREVNGRWLLDGTQGTLHLYGVGGGATCIKSVSPSERSGEYSLTSPVAGGAATLETAYSTTLPDQHVCGLTRLGGKFDTFSDRVWAKFYASHANWELEAFSDSSRVSMGVRCVHRNAW